MIRFATLVTLILALLPFSVQAKTASGTSIAAKQTATGQLTTTYAWSIGVSATPTSQVVPSGTDATVHWTISVTKGGGSGEVGAYLDGQVCVTNQGSTATQNLAISESLARPPSATVLVMTPVDVSAMPVLNPGQSFCYHYSVTIPSSAIVPGATYKTTGQVTITNQSSSTGTPSGPSPSSTAALPTTATPLGISVSDTNGQSFSFTASGSQSYDQTVMCNAGDGGLITKSTTVTIQSTGQTAQASAIIHCGWKAGDLTTYGQGDWGQGLMGPPRLLADHFGDAVGLSLQVGSASGGYSMDFGEASDVLAYMPASGTPGALTTNLIDPTTSSSGQFGGEAVALTLNVDFSDAGYTLGSSNLRFGDLTLCNLSSDTDLNGMTIRSFLGVVNTALGGGSTGDGIADLNTITAEVNAAFDSGTPSSFALQHIGKNSACAPVTWKTGDVISYSQTDWVTSLFSSDFDSLYLVFEIGIPGSAGYSIQFVDAAHLSTYLPSSGTPTALTEDLIDPASGVAGTLSGNVAALKLNVDFADAGLLAANSGLKFGDLALCGLSSDTDLNDMTVRDFLGLANTALGGGTHTDSYSDLDTVAANLNGSFGGGSVSTWAQDHLVNGSCP